ncbi:hypothetical protein NPIL_91021 [Nephila pilipes]|uniref:Uncharacterized protein n=1 Tax=Nephila pilipes TaxID=299642 RepID=A0A8X6NWM7_NEPPI|nr:hypothetical protein NPIL_91021 [Nephila pilipes]
MSLQHSTEVWQIDSHFSSRDFSHIFGNTSPLEDKLPREGEENSRSNICALLVTEARGELIASSAASVARARSALNTSRAPKGMGMMRNHSSLARDF